MTWIGFIPSTTSSDGDITGVTAGSGMTGGGTTGAVTLNLVGGDGITANANDMAITAAQTTITSVLNTSLVIGRDADNDIDFATDNQIIFRVGGGDNVIFKASGEIEATSLDISGDADIDGTMEADAITLGGTNIVSGSVITSLGTLSTLSVDNITINGNEISSTDTNGNIDLDPHGSGKVVFHGNATKGAGQFVLNCEVNTHGVTIKGPPHSASASYTLTLPNNDGDADQVLKTDGSGNLAWVTQSGGGGTGDMTQFYLEDDDGTEVTIDNNKEVKFIGSGITTNWTDTSTGNDGDPYDLTFTVDAAQTGITSLLATDIKIGEDDQTKIDFETADTINFYAGNEKQLVLTDGALTPGTNAILDLGTDALEFKDGYFDGTLEVDNLTIGGAQGTDGQVLTSTGSGVAWEDASGGGGSVSGNTFATDLKIGRDAHNLIDFTTDDEITFRVGDADGVVMKASGEIEATELDISGAIAMNSDQKLSFGHSSTFLEGSSSGTNLMLFGQSSIFFRVNLSTVLMVNASEFQFTVPPVPVSSDATALGSASKMWSDLFLASGGVVNFNNGDVTLTHSANTLTVGGGNLDTNRQLNKTSSTDFEAKGDIVYIGGGSTTQGELCYLKSDGEWAAADADATGTAGGVLLALALGTDPDADGMLLRGMFTLDHDPGTIADELYVSTTAGDITGTAPSGSGDIVRVIGYCLDSTNGQIWFNPSNDFIVLA